jgi:hypothetical protein
MIEDFSNRILTAPAVNPSATFLQPPRLLQLPEPTNIPSSMQVKLTTQSPTAHMQLPKFSSTIVIPPPVTGVQVVSQSEVIELNPTQIRYMMEIDMKKLRSKKDTYSTAQLQTFAHALNINTGQANEILKDELIRRKTRYGQGN